MDVTKLYTSTELPNLWIGEDAHGGLVQWPKAEGGYADRTPYDGTRRALREAVPGLARGTGWGGAGVGRKPRAAGIASAPFTIRASVDERASWQAKADESEMTLSDWAREKLNKAAK